jgi:CBS-domain-containing membrane protein
MSPSKGSVIRLLWCSLGVAAGTLVPVLLNDSAAMPLLVASFGGSAIFLFGLTRADAAQPRALLGGHLSGALVGIVCYQCFGEATWVYVVAEVATLWVLLLGRVVHPPAGANPIIMIHAHAGFSALLDPVLAGALGLMLLAMVWSRLYPGLVRYPVAWNRPSPVRPLWGGWDD